MLDNYSWSDYITAMAILIAGYYLVIGAIYYRTEVRDLLSGKIKFNRKKIAEHPSTADEGEYDEEFERLEAVVGDLKRSVLEQAGKEATKDQLLSQLKKRLANYDGLRRPAYRVAVNNAIIQNSKEICGVVFSEEELDAAWGTLPR